MAVNTEKEDTIMDALIALYLADIRCDAARDAMDEVKRERGIAGGFSMRTLPHNHPAVLECREARVLRARALQNPALVGVSAAVLLEKVEADRLDRWAPQAAEILRLRGETRTAQCLLNLLEWAKDAERRASA